MKATKRSFNKVGQYSRFIKKLFGNEEWQSFQPKSELSEETSEKMYAFILHKVDLVQEKEERSRNFRLKLLYTGKYIAAASIITLVGFALWFLAAPNSEQPTTNTISKLNKPTISQWEEIRNTNVNTRKIQLPDSSIVKLYPNASIKFTKIFKKDSRSIYLTGKAFFEVKKDPKRPFSVYAGGLKTTALGTAFTINTGESGNKTSVKLHHGKIVISNSAMPSQPPEYIAKAGSCLIYDPLGRTAVLIPSIPAKARVETSLVREGNIITFKNIPLFRVMQILKETYQVSITAETSIIGNTTYTGTVDSQKETAEDVLKVICIINNLTIVHSEATQEFIIKKHN